MRNYSGVKPAMALEFTQFVGSGKMFRSRFRGHETSDITRMYSANDIRNIRLSLMGAPDGFKRPKTIPPVINFRMAKGGTGKTTICGNVASCMALMGYKILMIDGDPQSSLSNLFGVDWVKRDVAHIGTLMRRAAEESGPTRIEEAVIPIYTNGMLDLIPADITMVQTDAWLTNIMSREHAFTRLLSSEIDFFSQYDAILIDSAPSVSNLTTVLMVACKTMLAVVMPEAQSLKALDVLSSNIMEMNKYFPGRDYGVHIVVNKYNQSKKPHLMMLGELIARYKKYMDDTVVGEFVGFLRENDVNDDANSGPVLEHEPQSRGARDIIELTKSLISHYEVQIIAASMGTEELAIQN
jgi:chromosome partitioning protein